MRNAEPMLYAATLCQLADVQMREDAHCGGADAECERVDPPRKAAAWLRAVSGTAVHTFSTRIATFQDGHPARLIIRNPQVQPVDLAHFTLAARGDTRHERKVDVHESQHHVVGDVGHVEPCHV